MIAKLIRIWGNEKETLGILMVLSEEKLLFVGKTLEIGWHENLPNESCIPLGKYQCEFTHSPLFSSKKGKDIYTYQVMNVPNRSGIRIHSANFYSQLLGCIALGATYKDLNFDGLMDVEHSGLTLMEFETLMQRDPFVLEIVQMQ